MPVPPHSTIRKLPRSSLADFDEQRWPVVLAILVLTGIVAGIAAPFANFTDPRPLYNAWTWVGSVALMLLILSWAMLRLRGPAVRRVQLGLLISLLFHLLLAIQLHQRYLALAAAEASRVADALAQDVPPELLPDYQWEYLEQSEGVQPFEQPVETQSPEPKLEPVQPAADDSQDAPYQPPQPVEPESASEQPEPVSLDRAELTAPRRADEFAGQPISRQEIERPPLEPGPAIPQPDVPQAAEASPAADAASATVERQHAAPELAQGEASEEPPADTRQTAAELARRADSRQPTLESAPSSMQRQSPAAQVAAAEVDAPDVPRATPGSAAAAALDAGAGTPARQNAMPKLAAQAAGDAGSPSPSVAPSAGRQLRNNMRPQVTAAAGRAAVSRQSAPAAIAGAAAEMPPDSGLTAGSRIGTSQSAVLDAGEAASVRRAAGEAPLAISRLGTVDMPGSSGSGVGPGRARVPRGVGSRSVAEPRLEPAAAEQPGGRGPTVAAIPATNVGEVDAGSTKSGSGSTASASGLEAAPNASLLGPGAPDVAVPGNLLSGTSRGSGDPVGAPAGAAVGVAGSRRIAGIGQARPSLAGSLAGSPLAKAAGPGLPGASADLPALAEAGPSAGVPSTDGGTQSTAAGAPQGGDVSGPARDAGALAVQIAADPGPGGLTNEPAPAAGIPSRRARLESNVVHAVPGRFVIGRSGGLGPLDGRAQEPVEAFRQRDPEKRARIAQGFGGTAGTEMAVELGLAYLARQQFPDGHWSLDRFMGGERPEFAQAGPGEMNSDTAATGLALLSFLGAGYTHREDKYQEVVRRGIEWLIANQQAGGELFRRETDQTRYARSYAHGMATIALCEAYGMTRDPAIRDPARRAIAYIGRAQHPQLGGWRYTPKDGEQTWQRESDTSVSGWQLMALKSAQMAGLEPPADVIQRVSHWLDLAQADGGARYRYTPYASDTPEQRAGRIPNLAMTAEGLLMRMYLGARRSDPALVAGVGYLSANRPALGSAEQSTRDAYYWYYATQVLFQMQGEHWAAWNDHLRPLLEDSQVKEGVLAGSWDARLPVADRWAHAGGRHYVTTLNLLMLEVYYRHLPLYRELVK